MSEKNRRRYKRFKASDRCYAAIRSGEGGVGRIKNISMGGLAFEYMETGKQKSASEDSEEYVDIFISGGKFMIRNILCRTVHNSYVAPNNMFLCTMGTRLLGIEFDGLSEQECHLLDSYISRCAKI